jgi:hypothetical protein
MGHRGAPLVGFSGCDANQHLHHVTNATFQVIEVTRKKSKPDSLQTISINDMIILLFIVEDPS